MKSHYARLLWHCFCTLERNNQITGCRNNQQMSHFAAKKIQKINDTISRSFRTLPQHFLLTFRNKNN